jgi:hypothetical protein
MINSSRKTVNKNVKLKSCGVPSSTEKGEENLPKTQMREYLFVK